MTQQAAKDVDRTAANDGGAWSLLGYMYQLLGTAGYASYLLLQGPAADNGAVAATIVVELEAAGQDAQVQTDGRTELIQFKYSSSGDDISPADLADILTTFETSERNLGQNHDDVQWVLATNREIGDSAANLLAGRADGVYPSTSPQHRITITRLRSRLTIQSFTLLDFQRQLSNHAKLFGVLDDSELPRRVIGFMMETVALPRGSRTVRQADLDALLAGYPQPKKIRCVDCKLVRQADLKEIARLQQGPLLEESITREQITSLLTRPDVALAAVTGPGGSGKTLSVLRSLHDVHDERASVAGALMSGPPPARTLDELIASWRSSSPVPREPLSDALRRVERANDQYEKPVLFLGLDGVDETRLQDGARDDVDLLISHFYQLHQLPQAPEAMLIVTCRTINELTSRLQPLGTGGIELRSPEEVRIGDFSENELRTVWRQWFRDEPPASVRMRAAEPFATMDRMDRPAKHATELVQAIRHPVVLGCLKRLGDDERQDLLAGSDPPWRRLLQEYLRWFITKACARRRQDQRRVVEAMLKAVARRCEERLAAGGIYNYLDDWEQPAQQATGETGIMIHGIFVDACTAGLIDVDGLPRFSSPTLRLATWTWHFGFLRQHLATLA